jgi:hypothetical protein
VTAALVQRPGRKMHLAGLEAGLWLSVCDRVALPLEGTRVTPLEAAVGTIDQQAGQVCRDCHRLILMADAAHQLGLGRLVASLEVAA